jgi:hypothetical protein
VKTAGQFGLIALIALGFWALPGGDSGLNVVFTLLTIVFFTVIALVVARLYREYRFTLEALSDRQRFALYGAVGLAFLTFCATNRLFDAGGAGVAGWFALLGVASYGLYWVYTSARRYD